MAPVLTLTGRADEYAADVRRAGLEFQGEGEAPGATCGRDGGRIRVRRRNGRFTQEDPIGLAGGLNLYGFANGDPVNFSDPFGLQAKCDPPGSCALRDMLTGAGAGATAGLALAVACTAGSGGVCALGAPALIGGGALAGATLGLTGGLIEEGQNLLGGIGRGLRKLIGGILIGVGAAGPLTDIDGDGQADVAPGHPVDISDPTRTGAGEGVVEPGAQAPPRGTSRGADSTSTRDPEGKDKPNQ